MTSLLSSIRQRGIGLSVWLGFVALANTYTAYRYYEILKDRLDHGQDVGTVGALSIVLGIAALFNVACMGALWRWKKWGWYGYLATSALGFVISLILKAALTTFVLPAVGLVLLWLLLRPQWPRFT